MVNDFFFGSIAGACAKTVIAPFDRIKILVQISNKDFKLSILWKIAKKIVNENGFRALWRGHTATLTRIVPYSGIQFSVNGYVTSFIKHKYDLTEKDLSPQTRFLCGCVAGVVSVSMTYPLDLIRTRMAVTDKKNYSNIISIFKVTVYNEGYKGLLRGMLPSIIGILPYSGSAFLTFYYLKNKIITSKMNDPSSCKDPSFSVSEKMLCGAFAGLLGQTASYPFDVVRRNLQTDGIGAKNYKFKSTADAVKYIYSMTNSFKGFYKGVSINWIKGPIATSISFTVFETLKQHFSTL